ncbi:MAG: hypothetical protein M3004_06215 [Bacteroidota bacterium]|nr:hypothetical protein [Bacteroidota bacterium]
MNLILNAIDIINERMEDIPLPDDFIKNKLGIIILDSINARLQSIGKNVNKITKSDKSLFTSQLQIDPLPIIDFRNIIHKICKDDLPILKQKIKTFLSNNNETV